VTWIKLLFPGFRRPCYAKTFEEEEDEEKKKKKNKKKKKKKMNSDVGVKTTNTATVTAHVFAYFVWAHYLTNPDTQ
jgi:uncharacterized protein (UPF0254 family)